LLDRNDGSFGDWLLELGEGVEELSASERRRFFSMSGPSTRPRTTGARGNPVFRIS
jgi:hypothetical protein